MITTPDLSREKSRNIICFWRTSPVIIFKSAVFQNFTSWETMITASNRRT